MKNILLIPVAALLLAGCDAKVTTTAPAEPEKEKVIEKNTTVVNNPPAVKEEKKVENNTTVINPPAQKEEKKVEKTTTTTVNP